MSVYVGACCNFARECEIAQAPLMREIEHLVRGSDYGATSWTTRQQAERSIDRLSLAAGHRLLDLGSGSGWPALYLAKLSGCNVVLTDLPAPGLHIARARAASDGLAARCSVVAADGVALPFEDRTFDRIHHADVLCCMDHKEALLRECRRVARPGARMEFSVISLARKPSGDDELRLLQRSGPPYPDAEEGYAALLENAGWRIIDCIDVTAEFARCMDVMLEAFHERREELLRLIGDEDYADRTLRRESTRTVVAHGMLKREIFVVALIEAESMI